MRTKFTLTFLCALLIVGIAVPCDLCVFPGPPLSTEITAARFVVFGNIQNSRLGPDGVRGTSDLKIEALIKADQTMKSGSTVTIARYVPPAPNTSYLVFLENANNQLDAYRSITCNSNRIVKYLQNMPTFTGEGTAGERQKRLEYCFTYLSDSESEIANDAFKEWAQAKNADVSAVAGKLQPATLRQWIADPKTADNRIALYAYLLGSCGQAEDQAFLTKLALSPPSPKMAGALDGYLAGLIRMNPKAGWDTTRNILTQKSTITQQLALLRMLKFVYDTTPDLSKPDLLSVTKLLLEQDNAFDITVTQLRRWKLWDHTDLILKQYTNPKNESVVAKRAILQYALQCPAPAVMAFLEQVKKNDPDAVKDAEELLQFEQPAK